MGWIQNRRDTGIKKGKAMRISIIGCGNMGAAIAAALETAEGYEVSVYDSNQNKAAEFCRGRRITLLDDMEKAKGSDVIIIAVKPQVLPSLYNQLSDLKPGLFISIAAGVPLKVLEEKLMTGNIVRFMPNIAAKCKSAVTAVALGSTVKDDSIPLSIASSFGSAFILPENLFPAFIGISGSAIAYVFEFIHYLALGGVKEGIPYPQSAEIAKDTLMSAIKLMEDSGKGAIELETMVCSAAGTTIEGVEALSEGAFGFTVMKAAERAAAKSRELEKNA